MKAVIFDDAPLRIIEDNYTFLHDSSKKNSQQNSRILVMLFSKACTAVQRSRPTHCIYKLNTSLRGQSYIDVVLP